MLAPPPPDAPPPEIIEQLTLNGSIALEYFYVDDSNKGLGIVSPIHQNVLDAV